MSLIMTSGEHTKGADLLALADRVDRIIVRKNGEWAFAYIDEETGVFTCYSSFGTYGYCWGHRGGETLHEFLLDLNFDYFMGKARGRDYLRFDAETTIRDIKAYIREQRRCGDLTKDEARSAWDDSDALESQTGEAFFSDFCSTRSLMKVYHGDYCDIAREAPASDCVGFWKVIWPELTSAIRSSAQSREAQAGGGA